jgi:hypothetical protein
VGRGVRRARASGEEERKWGKGGGRGGEGDRFKSARRGGGRPAERHHVESEGRERGREGGRPGAAGALTRGPRLAAGEGVRMGSTAAAADTWLR